ncbi:MAG: RagB/SusD family nutrient uptake outer membrane protein, partial [Tannerella sp.]|nr:RagB/SusD family nutrient uptake outer membrane protein [Tannerella sp.]
TITNSAYTTINYPWPEYRLSDLYLLYAEALNESQGPTDEVYNYLNPIRARAGLPTVQESWTNFSTNPDKYRNQEGLREIIHRERLIELAFEFNRMWDLRRWKKAVEEQNKPITGWDILNADAREYYREKTLFATTFYTRDYFWPLSEKVLLTNPNLVQNPGW